MSDFEPKNQDFRRAVKDSFERQGLMHALGIGLLQIESGRVELEVPFSERVAQQHGYFHGALVGAVMDSAGGYAGLTLMPPGSEVLTTEYKVNFVAPARGEVLIARGEVVKPGRTLTVTQVQAFGVDAGARRLVAVMLQSLFRVEHR
jgi:uncharacterized protein (TIGR00369 family)